MTTCKFDAKDLFFVTADGDELNPAMVEQIRRHTITVLLTTAQDNAQRAVVEHLAFSLGLLDLDCLK